MPGLQGHCDLGAKNVRCVIKQQRPLQEISTTQVLQQGANLNLPHCSKGPVRTVDTQ